MANLNFTKLVCAAILLISPGLIFSQSNTSKAPAKKRPNILFCIADDASREYMGAYGFKNVWVNTPAFDRVAKEGILFENAYTPNAKCAPSRACILTGRNSWQLEEAANHGAYYPAKFTTFMEALGKNGYYVGFTGKGWAPGNPGQVNGHPRLLTGPEFSDIKMNAPTKEISPTDYASNFAEFLKNRPKGEPFCFWYGGHEPHRAYEYGSGAAKGHKNIADIKQVPPYWPDVEEVRNDMLDYAYELEYFDQHLGRILDILQKSGELDNTIIVVTSDNGMPFPRVKGHVYERDNHLPLAIMWKDGIKATGRHIKDMVSFIDFAPTFLEIAGVKSDAAKMQPIQGQSLMNIITSKKDGIVESGRDHVLVGRERTDVGRPNDEGYPVRGIVEKNFFYTKNYEPGRWPCGNPETGYLDTDGSPTKTAILQGHRNGQYMHLWDLSFGKRPSEELYDISKDPYCMNNLANDPAYGTIKEKLRLQMENELKTQGDPRMFGKGYVFDQYKYGEPKVVNFYERFMKGEKIKAGWVNESDFEKPQNKSQF